MNQIFDLNRFFFSGALKDSMARVIRWRAWLFFGVASLVLLTAGGCGNRADQLLMEQGKSLVEQCLQAWLDKKTPEDLKGLSPSITFFDDDWNRKATLLSYEIIELFVEHSDGTPRVGVRLKIRQANGRDAEVRCAYQVVFEPEIVIARDPMS